MEHKWPCVFTVGDMEKVLKIVDAFCQDQTVEVHVGDYLIDPRKPIVLVAEFGKLEFWTHCNGFFTPKDPSAPRFQIPPGNVRIENEYIPWSELLMERFVRRVPFEHPVEKYLPTKRPELRGGHCLADYAEMPVGIWVFAVAAVIMIAALALAP